MLISQMPQPSLEEEHSCRDNLNIVILHCDPTHNVVYASALVRVGIHLGFP